MGGGDCVTGAGQGRYDEIIDAERRREQTRERVARYRQRRVEALQAQVKAAARQAEIERYVWQMLAPYYDD